MIRKWYIQIGSAALVLALLVWFFWGTAASGKVTILATSTVAQSTVSRVLDATGITTPEVGASVKTGSRATGLIKKMHVRVGDYVTREQVIALIDDREAQANLQEAEANYLRATAEYTKVISSYPLQIREVTAQIHASSAEAAYARTSYSRYKTLVEQDLEARDALDSARQKRDTTAGGLRVLEATLERLQSEFEQNSNSTLQSMLQAQAARDTAQIRLSYTVITSPIEGLVSQVTAQEGETVVAGLEVANLITIIDPSRLEMWIYVDETDVGLVTAGMPVEFTVDAFVDRIFTGKIDQIYPEPEIKDNIVYYKALVTLDPETSKTLRPEMTTHCKIMVESKEAALSIPNEAVKWVDGKEVVYVQTGESSVRAVHPEFGLRGYERSELLGDALQEGEVVVTRIVLPGAKAPGTGKS